MIIVEERLKELFDTLPDVEVRNSAYKPMYNFGSLDDLSKYIKSKIKEGGKRYPLIWLETPFKDTGDNRRIRVDLKLVLATKTTSDLSNIDRVETSFKEEIMPMYNNILKAFRMSGFTRIIDFEKSKRTKYYNYGVSDGKENITTDIWDAIKFECELELTNNKLEIIHY